MDISRLQRQLEGKLPPLERWSPEFCGDFPIEITAQGDWLYLGSQIKRSALVKLFANVLVYEQQQYFLKTPVEKVRIKVSDAPFIIVASEQRMFEQQPVICIIDNIGRQFVLCQEHSIQLKEHIPYVLLPHNCLAKVHRNVYYQWAELAQQQSDGFYLHSGEDAVKIGEC